jgi:hypothetical protein
MVIPLSYLYLNDDKIQLLYDATSKEITGERKVTVKTNLEASGEVNAKTSALLSFLAELGGSGSGKAGKEKTEEYTTTTPLNKKLQSLESYFKENNIKIFNLNKEKDFKNYIGNFVTATILFKGTISEEILDLNGNLDDFSVHMFASKKFLKTATGHYRITHSAVPVGLNVFGVLRGIDVTTRIMEIDPIAF